MGKSQDKTKWKLVNPEALVQVEAGQVNPHPKDFRKDVVLYWNGKPNGDLFLNRIGELLIEKVDNVKVIKAWKFAHRQNGRTRRLRQAGTAEELAGLGLIFIGAPGLRRCTTWLVVDQLNLERLVFLPLR